MVCGKFIVELLNTLLKQNIYLQFQFTVMSTEVLEALEDFSILIFFVIIFYECQPKKLSAIMALSNQGEVLPVTEIKTELHENDDN